jgi:hypothetical protein
MLLLALMMAQGPQCSKSGSCRSAKEGVVGAPRFIWAPVVAKVPIFAAKSFANGPDAIGKQCQPQNAFCLTFDGGHLKWTVLAFRTQCISPKLLIFRTG